MFLKLQCLWWVILCFNSFHYFISHFKQGIKVLWIWLLQTRLNYKFWMHVVLWPICFHLTLDMISFSSLWNHEFIIITLHFKVSLIANIVTSIFCCSFFILFSLSTFCLAITMILQFYHKFIFKPCKINSTHKTCCIHTLSKCSCNPSCQATTLLTWKTHAVHGIVSTI